MRKLATLSLGLVAVLAAACSSTGGSTSSRRSLAERVGRRVRRRLPVRPPPRPRARRRVRQGQPHDGDRRQADGRDGQPGLSAVLPPNAGGASSPRRGRSRTRPTAKGFESAVAYAIADQLGFAKADVAWIVGPVRRTRIEPGPKTFDIDLNQVDYNDRADADGRPVGRLLLRQPGPRRPQGQPARQGDHRRRAQGLRVRRAGRHDQLRRDRLDHRADQEGARCTTRTSSRSRP